MAKDESENEREGKLTTALMIECTPKMAELLDSLVATGLFGPSRDTAAQRLLELKMFELGMAAAKVTDK